MSEETILLVGGPMPGLHTWTGGDELIVVDMPTFPLQVADVPPEGLSVKLHYHRGVYRRRGETSYFDWQGWR